MRWGIVLSLGLALTLSVPVMAQQKGKTLTNDDFPSGQQVTTKEDSKADKDKDKEGEESEETKDGKPLTEKEKAEKEKADKEKKKAQEAWQQKFDKAQQKANELDRQKTEAELTAQRLREQLRRGGEPGEVEAIANQLRAAENRLKDLNGQYDEAKKGIESAKGEGETKGYKYKKEEIPKTDKEGRPNKEYYTKNYSELSEKQKLAEQKLQLYQTRINEAQQRAYQARSTNPNKVGNPYYTDPEVKKTFEESKAEMQKLQEEMERINAELEKLQRDAKSKGVPVQ